MAELREQLEKCFRERVCIMGVGSADYGDDGLGMHLANELSAAGVPHVIAAGTAPERFMGWVAGEKFGHLLFLDAVEFGGAPGAVVFLNAGEIAARFPQISTHKISLGLLSQWTEANGTTRAWLLGVQPESLEASAQLSGTVRQTVDILRDLLVVLARHGWRAAGNDGQTSVA